MPFLKAGSSPAWQEDHSTKIRECGLITRPAHSLHRLLFLHQFEVGWTPQFQGTHWTLWPFEAWEKPNKRLELVFRDQGFIGCRHPLTCLETGEATRVAIKAGLGKAEAKLGKLETWGQTEVVRESQSQNSEIHKLGNGAHGEHKAWGISFNWAGSWEIPLLRFWPHGVLKEIGLVEARAFCKFMPPSCEYVTYKETELNAKHNLNWFPTPIHPEGTDWQVYIYPKPEHKE